MFQSMSVWLLCNIFNRGNYNLWPSGRCPQPSFKYAIGYAWLTSLANWLSQSVLRNQAQTVSPVTVSPDDIYRANRLHNEEKREPCTAPLNTELFVFRYVGREVRNIYNVRKVDRNAVYSNDTLPIWLDDVRCNGTERHIADCQHNAWGMHNCAQRENVAISCYRKFIQ